MNNMQAKQHKVIHRIDERLSAVEGIVITAARVSAVLLIMIGLCGFSVALYFDKISRGIWQEFGWLQISGMVIFLGVLLSGIVIATIVRGETNT